MPGAVRVCARDPPHHHTTRDTPEEVISGISKLPLSRSTNQPVGGTFYFVPEKRQVLSKEILGSGLYTKLKIKSRKSGYLVISHALSFYLSVFSSQG